MAKPSTMPMALSAAFQRTLLPSERWLMPVAKLSPISHATISSTLCTPNVIINDRNGSPVKFTMPSQVRQPEASDSRMAAAPSSASCQLLNAVSSTVFQSRARNPLLLSA